MSGIRNQGKAIPDSFQGAALVAPWIVHRRNLAVEDHRRPRASNITQFDAVSTEESK